jgi:hypothetical protein
MITTGKPPTTKDFYSVFTMRGVLWKPTQWVWRREIPPSRKIFLWLAYRGRLNTKDNMNRKKWISDAGCDRCPAVESMNHIILHCQYAQWVWEKLDLTEEAARAQLISGFVDAVKPATDENQWPTCFAACGWVLWTARNDCVFNARTRTRRMMLENIADVLKLWATRAGKDADALQRWANKFTS